MFRKLCGESTLQNVVLVTNMWGDESMAVNESREREIFENFLRPAINKGAQMARHHDTTESAHNILRMIINNDPVVLQIQRELVDENKHITDTEAGEMINQEIRHLIKKHEAELNEIRYEMRRALQERDEETRRELNAIRRELEEKVMKVKEARDGLVANYAEEREMMMAEMREVEERAKREREQVIADHDRELAALTERLDLTPDAFADERAWLEQEIKVMRDSVTVPIYE